MLQTMKRYQFAVYKTQVGDVMENPLIRLIVEGHLAYVEKLNL